MHWTLTHIPSGYGVWTLFRTRKVAERYVPALEAIPGIKLVRSLNNKSKAYKRMYEILFKIVA